MVRNKGLPSQGWYNDVIKMGDFGDRLYGKWDPNEDRNRIRITEDQAQKVTAILTKYFGPNSPLPTREQVTHPRISDAALRATFREYKVPTKSYIHTIH